MSIAINQDNMLGFGLMRLPVTDGQPMSEHVDISAVADMADEFLKAGFTYFDTSFVYHDGHSENAVKEAIVKKHSRDAFTIATKFPTMLVKSEDEVEGYFEKQLANVGVDYFDYYLLHILTTQWADPVHGTGIVEKCRLFEHMIEWQKQGKAKHIGFSFHDSHEVLDKLLTDHPEVEFVQLVINYYDWDSSWIQSRENLETARRHGKAVVAMEPVKGGYLAEVPDACLELMRGFDAEATPAAWAVRFAASCDGVFKSLSGMSTMQQVKDNTAAMKRFKPLSDKEREMLFECAHIMRVQNGTDRAALEKYKGLTFHGIPVADLLEAYRTCMDQPMPGFAADNNYLRQQLLKEGVTDMKQSWPEEKVVCDGQDITDEVRKAWNFLVDNAF